MLNTARRRCGGKAGEPRCRRSKPRTASSRRCSTPRPTACWCSIAPAACSPPIAARRRCSATSRRIRRAHVRRSVRAGKQARGARLSRAHCARRRRRRCSTSGREAIGRVRQGGLVPLYITHRAHRRRREILRGVARHHRLEAHRRGTDQCPPRGREGLHREVGIPRQDQPRDPHAAQRHHRLFRGDDGGALRAGRQRPLPAISQGHSRLRRPSDLAAQRSARPVQDRGRQARPDLRQHQSQRPRPAMRRHHAAAGQSRARDHPLLARRRACRRSSPTRARCARSRSICCRTRSSSPAPAGRSSSRPRSPTSTRSCLRVRDTGARHERAGIADRARAVPPDRDFGALGLERHRASACRSPRRWRRPITRAFPSPAASTAARWWKWRSRRPGCWRNKDDGRQNKALPAWP